MEWSQLDSGESQLRAQRIFICISGFLIGFLGSYYVQMHYYAYFPYSSMCIGSIHWHHLYTGLIIIILGSIFAIFVRKKPMSWYVWHYSILFIISFGLGMFIDDLTDHWLFRFDPFEFYCTRV